MDPLERHNAAVASLRKSVEDLRKAVDTGYIDHERLREISRELGRLVGEFTGAFTGIHNKATIDSMESMSAAFRGMMASVSEPEEPSFRAVLIAVLGFICFGVVAVAALAWLGVFW